MRAVISLMDGNKQQTIGNLKDGKLTKVWKFTKQ